jgi:hypothetical protein
MDGPFKDRRTAWFRNRTRRYVVRQTGQAIAARATAEARAKEALFRRPQKRGR